MNLKLQPGEHRAFKRYWHAVMATGVNIPFLAFCIQAFRFAEEQRFAGYGPDGAPRFLAGGERPAQPLNGQPINSAEHGGPHAA